MPAKKKSLKILTSNLKAITASTKKVTKAVTAPAKKLKALSNKRSYTVRDLPVKFSTSPKKLIANLEAKSDQIDKLRKPGEMWAFTIGRNKSLYPFETFDLMIRKLTEYKSYQLNDKDFADAIKFVKFRAKGVDTSEELNDEDYESTVDSYRESRERTQRKNRKVVETVEKRASKQVEKKSGKKPKTKFEILKGVLDINDALTAQVDALNKRLAEMEKLLKTKPKKASKKAVKKTTPKKGKVKSNVTVKPTKKGTKQKAVSVPKVKSNSSRKKAPVRSNTKGKSKPKKSAVKKAGKRK